MIHGTSRSPYWAVLLLFLVLACAAPDPEPVQPNILFIYVDDLGWKDLGVMGSTYYETPNIDGLAEEGMLFTSAYANAPNCAPSRACLLTGMYTPRHGIYTVNSAERGNAANRALIPVENKTTLPLETVTLAEALRNLGYHTGHIGKWHLGGDGHLPEDQGFEWSVAGDDAGTPASYFYPYRNRSGRTIPDLDQGAEGEYLADRLSDEAVRFIQRNREGPFFLYLSHYSVHTPIRAKPELIERYRSKPGSGGHDNPTYAAMVHSVDEGVGRVLATLDSLDLAESTVVFFFSDNGGYGPATSMSPLRGSKGMLYEGGIRVPLLVRWPGHIAPGSVSGEQVIGTDLFPTILEMAGGIPGPNRVMDGRSLIPVLERSGPFDVRPLFWHFPAYLEAYRSGEGPWRTTPASAIRLGRHKLIYFFEEARGTAAVGARGTAAVGARGTAAVGGPTELYDLVSDPSESVDLSEEMPEIHQELLDRLRAWWEETDAFIPTEPNPEYRGGATGQRTLP
jgi:arylsulfatase A-like enzyme